MSADELFAIVRHDPERWTRTMIDEVRGHPDYGMRLRSCIARRHQAAAKRALVMPPTEAGDGEAGSDEADK